MIAQDYWIGMPEFKMDKVIPFFTGRISLNDGTNDVMIRADNKTDLDTLSQRIGGFVDNCVTVENRTELAHILEQRLTDKTKSVWYPYKSHWGGVKYKYTSNKPIQNRYPVYVVSKGRWDNGLTTKALAVMDIYHFIVVEQDELSLYEATANDHATLLVLPEHYLTDYDTCDEFGDTKSRGPGSARNFCIDHSTQTGVKRHWVMDDNLDAFHYLNRNEKYEVEAPSTIAAAEDFIDRFSNVPLAGLNYYSFCKKTDKVPPFTFNTRIYSCLLVENSSGYRWRGRYNEDTDISLRILKDGFCTIQLNAFLCGKVTTQRMKGGNTEEFYNGEGTLPKSQMLADLHPDVAKVVWRFNRWHHHVDYRPFRDNQLQLVEPNKQYVDFDNYGLVKVNK